MGVGRRDGDDGLLRGRSSWPRLWLPGRTGTAGDPAWVRDPARRVHQKASGEMDAISEGPEPELSVPPPQHSPPLSAEAMSRSERKLRARVAELLLVVLTSSECGEDLKAYMAQVAQELGLLQVVE